jgi:hypothetical protein
MGSPPSEDVRREFGPEDYPEAKQALAHQICSQTGQRLSPVRIGEKNRLQFSHRSMRSRFARRCIRQR